MKYLILASFVLSASVGFASTLEERVVLLERKVLELEGKGVGKYYSNKPGAVRYDVGSNCSEIRPAKYGTRHDSWKMHAFKEITCDQVTYVFTQIENSMVEVYNKNDLVELSN